MAPEVDKARQGDNTVADQFAANLVRLRNEAGLSQEDLAKRAGIHRTQVSMMEAGKRLPRFETLLRIFASLGVSADALFEEIDYEPIIEDGGEIFVGGRLVKAADKAKD